MTGERDQRYGERLASLIAVEERPGFRGELRARLLAQVGPASVKRPRAEWLARLRPFALAAAAIALLVVGGGYATAASLPDEPAFALKRAAEEVLFALASDDETRVERLVAQTRTRLGEVRRAGGRAHAAELGLEEYVRAVERLDALIERLASAPDSTRRDGSLALALTALDEQGAVLEALRALVPAQASGGIDRAIDAQRNAQERVPWPAPPGTRPGATPRPDTPGVPTRTTQPPRGPPASLPASPRSP